MRTGRMAIAAFALCLTISWTSGASASSNPFTKNVEFRTGDVIFQQISGRLGRFVQGMTRSVFDHCGIVVVNPNGTVDVLEAITLVQRTSLEKWVGRGVDQRFHLMRASDALQDKIAEVIAAAENFLGRPYDRRFRLDDERLYCSEFVYKAFLNATGTALAPMQELTDLNFLRHVPEIVALSAGDPEPWTQKVITPVALSRSEHLKLIHTRFAADHYATVMSPQR